LPSVDLQTELRRLYGFPSFRGVQQPIVEHFLGGGSALVLMATGDGKSLCYQLPALVGEGLTIVVSPLIALMDDQVAALRKRNLPATCIHSLLDRGERQRRLVMAQRGEVKLLYVTPERFRVEGFLEPMRGVPITRLAVDEAHCVSHWGHDFRPDYLRLGEVRQALGNPPCLALTATATPDVQDDIRAVLGLRTRRCFHTGIARDNLFLSVHDVHTDDGQARSSAHDPRAHRRSCDRLLRIDPRPARLEGELQRRGFAPLVYHGDLSAHERQAPSSARSRRVRTR
jgi:ATP-dependent DNA helicase RecQ